MPRTRVFTRSKPFQPSSSSSSSSPSHHSSYSEDNYKSHGRPSRRDTCGKLFSQSYRNQNGFKTWYNTGFPAESRKTVEEVEDPLSLNLNTELRSANVSPYTSTNSEDSPTIFKTKELIDQQITKDVPGGSEISGSSKCYLYPPDKYNHDHRSDKCDAVIGRSNPASPVSNISIPVLTKLSNYDAIGEYSLQLQPEVSPRLFSDVDDSDPMPRRKVHAVVGLSESEKNAWDEAPLDSQELSVEDGATTTASSSKGRRRPRRRARRNRVPAQQPDNMVVLPNVSDHWDADSGVEVCSPISPFASKGGDSPNGRHTPKTARSPSDDRMTSSSEQSDGSFPFYFKEPDIDPELLLCNDAPLPWNLDDFHDDEDSVFSWSEFDVEPDGDCHKGEIISIPIVELSQRHSSEDLSHCKEDEEVGCAEQNLDYDEEDSASLAVSRDELHSADAETDYDSLLPAHVLMHVKRDLVSVLMEYGQTREVKVTFTDMLRSGPHHASRFHTSAIVDGKVFPEGCGSSKKNAKKAAAAYALQMMYDDGKQNLQVVNIEAHRKLLAMTDEEVGSHAHRVVLVSRHVLDTCEETQFINYSKDKIAATFVLEHNGKMKVVGLGTGNRCILYQNLTLDGQRVIHSHAEIIARRAFLRYLYKQLLTYDGKTSHPILTRSDTGKLKLRDKIQVHLYISRPPCGDAAAFPTINNFPNRMRAIRKQGQLRTIIDDGEGAIPTDFTVTAGANGKERLRIMTCSDKICRWNVLGVQGALLSHFLDPIYLNSLVIGSHTGEQRDHVPRAISGRLKCGRLHEVIQRPYRLNCPEIHYPHDDLSDTYNITKSKQYCITWTLGDDDAEVIDAITGLVNMEPLESVVRSRVSKLTLFDLFQQVCEKCGRQDLCRGDYARAKKSATTFQRMKSFVGQHLIAMGFGQWFSLQETYGTDAFDGPGSC